MLLITGFDRGFLGNKDVNTSKFYIYEDNPFYCLFGYHMKMATPPSTKQFNHQRQDTDSVIFNMIAHSDSEII